MESWQERQERELLKKRSELKKRLADPGLYDTIAVLQNDLRIVEARLDKLMVERQ